MNSSSKFNVLRTALSIGIALGISFLIILCVSEEPTKAIWTLLTGPLKNKRLFGNVIELTIPLIFTGVGVAIMFSANQINLAGEGAFHIGGLVATALALNVALPAGISPIVCLLFAGLAGALITTVPAVMKIKTTSDELVSSLMINYLVLFFSNYILNYFLKDPQAGATVSYKIPELATLGTLIKGTRIHYGLLIAILVSIGGYIFLYKTKIGYELRITGQNEQFARYSGINIVKVVLISQILGGFIAGLGGGVELLGMYTRLSWTGLLGYGWDAIIVTTLAKNNPLYCPISAFFLAYLRTGAAIMSRSTDVAPEIVSITQGLIILLVVAEQFLSKYKHKMVAKEAKATLQQKEAK